MAMLARLPRFLRIVLALLAGLVLLCLLVFGTFYVVIQTEAGRERIASWVERMTEASQTARVEIEGLGPGLPFRIEAQKVALADAEGVWMRAEDVIVEPDLWELLDTRFVLDLVRASRLDLLRQPQSGEEDAAAAEGFTLPKSLPEAEIRELDVEQVVIHEAVAGERKEWSLEASARIGDKVRIDLLGKSVEDGETVFEASGSGRLTSSGFEADFMAVVHPASGLAPLAGLPEDAGLRARLTGEGGTEEASGSLEVTSKGQIELDTKYTVRFKPNLRSCPRTWPTGQAGGRISPGR